LSYPYLHAPGVLVREIDYYHSVAINQLAKMSHSTLSIHQYFLRNLYLKQNRQVYILIFNPLPLSIFILI
ncbi:hypothetical protein MXZ96_15270, partial [Providencia stuartii]|uniref:hypothetical protein n=1 Tax=Providencia stuartii TaxID=588 RepID=UPI001FF24230